MHTTYAYPQSRDSAASAFARRSRGVAPHYAGRDTACLEGGTDMSDYGNPPQDPNAPQNPYGQPNP